MPENETLTRDSKTASRWQPICYRLDAGLSPAQVFPDIQDQFYACLGRVLRHWRESGVDLGQLIVAALNDPVSMAQLIRQTRFDDYARVLRDVALGLEVATTEGLIRAFLNAVWESVRDYLQLDFREDAQSFEFTDLVNGMLDRMANSLLLDPSRSPRRPPSKEPRPDLDTQLGENLL